MMYRNVKVYIIYNYNSMYSIITPFTIILYCNYIKININKFKLFNKINFY